MTPFDSTAPPTTARRSATVAPGRSTTSLTVGTVIRSSRPATVRTTSSGLASWGRNTMPVLPICGLILTASPRVVPANSTSWKSLPVWAMKAVLSAILTVPRTPRLPGACGRGAVWDRRSNRSFCSAVILLSSSWTTPTRSERSSRTAAASRTNWSWTASNSFSIAWKRALKPSSSGVAEACTRSSPSTQSVCAKVRVYVTTVSGSTVCTSVAKSNGAGRELPVAPTIHQPRISPIFDSASPADLSVPATCWVETPLTRMSLSRNEIGCGTAGLLALRRTGPEGGRLRAADDVLLGCGRRSVRDRPARLSRAARTARCRRRGGGGTGCTRGRPGRRGTAAARRPAKHGRAGAGRC